MSTLSDIRLAWVKLPVHTRIMVLEELVKADKVQAHSWARKIPHEMSHFNAFFKDYTPFEMMQIKANSVNGKKYTPRFDFNCGYFVYNPEAKILTSVEDIELTLRNLFDEILGKLGSQVVIDTLEKLQKNNFTVEQEFIVPPKTCKEIADMISKGNTLVIKVATDYTGKYTVDAVIKEEG